jgi:membrane associated rhomboid family serine protease
MSAVETALRVFVILGLLLGAATARRLDRSGVGWGERLRRRYILGVPWGTVVTLGIVFGVYLIFQGGWSRPTDPLTVPFVSWSYLYPLGWLTAPFAHSGLGHLTGNVVATVLLGPIAEYAWGHYPRSRGSTSFGSLLTNPFVRAFVVFPVGVILVGLATSVFHWGPLIGFSGVVYAFAGFGLVTFPVTTVLALVARSVVSTTYQAFRDPVLTASPGPSFGGPWWAGIAVEGHLFGIVIGVVLAVLYLRWSDDDPPTATRLWIASILVGFTLTLWAIWWYGPGNSYQLFRGPGVLLVLVLATVITAAVTASTRDLLPRFGPIRTITVGVTRRRAATLMLVLALTTMGAIAIPVNLTTVQSGSPPDGAVEVRDYAVFYAEGVRNENVPAVDVSFFGASTNVTTSGVIVVNRERHLWTRQVSAGSLAFFGFTSVRVGGTTWSETVDILRQGWVPRGGDPVYTVSLRPPDGEWRQTFASDGHMAEPTIAGRNVSVHVSEGNFVLNVSSDGEELARVPIPGENESVEAGGLTFERTGRQVVVIEDGTRLVIAQHEEYN